jgi:CBS domain-containing protein
MKVREVMKKDPVCCISQNSALDAAWLMKSHNYGCLPVVTGPTTNRLIGIVTDRDLCMAVIPRGVSPSSVTVATAMSKAPVTCGPDDDVETCAALMRHYAVRRIPIIDEHGSCIGLVSHTDLAQRCQADLVKQTEKAFADANLALAN